MAGSSVKEAKKGFIMSRTTMVTITPHAAERMIPFETTLLAIS